MFINLTRIHVLLVFNILGCSFYDLYCNMIVPINFSQPFAINGRRDFRIVYNSYGNKATFFCVSNFGKLKTKLDKESETKLTTTTYYKALCKISTQKYTHYNTSRKVLKPIWTISPRERRGQYSISRTSV